MARKYLEPSAAARIDLEPSAAARIDLEPSTAARIDLEPSTAARIDLEPSTAARIDLEPSTAAKSNFCELKSWAKQFLCRIYILCPWILAISSNIESNKGIESLPQTLIY